MHENQEEIDVKKETRKAALYILALPALLFAQAPEVRVVQTNQIPENPAKMIEIVNAPEPERPVAVVEEPVPLGAPVAVRGHKHAEERIVVPREDSVAREAADAARILDDRGSGR